TMSDRSRARAASAAAVVPALVRFKRHGALCSINAATPPRCATAAEVPKNTFPNEPAPVTATPSTAVTSGFTRPSSVGPRLLKNSMVEFDVSLHDSLFDERPAAVEVA